MSVATNPDGRDEPRGSEPPDRGWLLRRVRDQRVAFVLVGGVNTAVGFLAFVGFDRLYAALAPGWGSVVHNTLTLGCAHVVSVIIAFVLYRTLVFRVTGQVWRDFVRFESVYLVSLGVNWLLLNLLTVVLGLSAIVAQALVVAIIAMVSFFGHKHFSFRRSASTDPMSDPTDPISEPGDRTPPGEAR
jgi:putative flippase GtrA